MANPSLLILPGDGIGPEVMTEVRKIIGWFDSRRGIAFDVSEGLVGGAAYDAHGTPLTDFIASTPDELPATGLGSHLLHGDGAERVRAIGRVTPIPRSRCGADDANLRRSWEIHQ